MSNKKAVVLLSGGLDSTVTLYFAKSRKFECRALAFDYGQRHRREIESAKKVAEAAMVQLKVLKISLPWKGSSLLDKRNISRSKGLLIPNTYVPARNIIFLSFALSFAEASGSNAIFIGAHAQDYSGYPDCRPEFFRVFNKVALTGTKTGVEKKGIEIKVPLLNMGKAEIIRLGSRLKVPFELTWSCYKGGEVPCGVCDSCYYRNKGFKEARIRDGSQLKAKLSP